jgi:hypothetical protein
VAQNPVPSDNVWDYIAALERRVAAAEGRTLRNVVIPEGGVTIRGSGGLTVTSEDGTNRVFAGGSTNIPLSDGSPQPMFAVYDGNGQQRFAVYDPLPAVDGYVPVVWVRDHMGRVSITTDRNGGLAEPWISVPMYPRFFPSAFLDSTSTDPTLPVSACNGNTVWEGRIGKVSHPRIQYDITAGRVTGSSGVPTYRFFVGGVELDSFSQTAQGGVLRGPLDISSQLGQTNVPVKITVSATGTGTDRIAAGMYGVWLRQT